MKKEEKINAILENIAFNYNEFQKQAKNKLKKQSKIVNPTEDYRDLVCDVVYSIIDNLKTLKEINRFYKMYKENKLKLYIFKAIDINTRYATSPFLRKKISEYKRFVVLDNINYNTNNFEEIYEDNGFLFYYIMSLIEPPYAKKILGEDWRYYSDLFKEYINDVDSTYVSIEKKYNLPSSTLYRDINYVKNKIKEELTKNKKYLKTKIN
jgi:hypothetical protein